MRLCDFISENIEPILTEWESFARSIWPGTNQDAYVDPKLLRDDAAGILHAAILDMETDQSVKQQSKKSKGEEGGGENSSRLNSASERHGAGRVGSGFGLWAVVAEYRALRASVLRLWQDSDRSPDINDIDDVTRFNECVDQSLTHAVESYTQQIDRDREAMIVNERAARKDAENANRAKDLFLANLSHELRTPLNAIVGWISILRIAGHSEENLTEGLDVIERNTKAQVQLIEDVLDVSRIVSGKLRLEIRECDLIDTINASIEVLRPAAEAKDIAFDVELEPEARRAACDAARIQQVVWNLLSNALKFTPSGGTIRVKLAREDSNLRMIVSDNGKGISPELMPYIFDRFRQADSSTRRTFGGLGLGLSIVKHLAEMHGGTVEAQSSGDGQGATFTVRLPIKSVLQDEVNEEHPSGTPIEDGINLRSSPARLDGLRLFVVDDEADARQMLAKVLQSVGAHVITAANVKDAIATLASSIKTGEVPDVLISDIGMPVQDGYDLIRQVRELGHLADKLPAVALTAFARANDANEATSAGFQVHVPKPVDVRRLTEVIRSLVGQN